MLTTPNFYLEYEYILDTNHYQLLLKKKDKNCKLRPQMLQLNFPFDHKHNKCK